MMEVVYWQGNAWETDYQHLKYQDCVAGIYIHDIVNNYQKEIPAIQSVEIETVNRCNNDCSFCPVAAGRDKRERKIMSDSLFYAIIDELADMDYRGYISLFSNNEPLLDPRLFEFLRYAKEKLPHARHALYTNGTLLTVEKYQELIKYLDYLVIDNYNDEFHLNPNIQTIYQNDLLEQTNCKVRVEVRKKNQVLSNRGGLAPNKSRNNLFMSACILPFMQMVIRPDGKVSLCCQDAYGNTTLGDVEKEGICGVWEGEAYQRIRQEFIKNGRIGQSRCKVCDLFDLHNYFPSEWIHIYVTTFINILWQQKKQGKKLTLLGSSDDAHEISELLYQHGLSLDYVEEKITDLHQDKFYILPYFDWKYLEKFDPLAAGGDYIVFQNPVRRQLQKDIQPNSIVDLYGKVCRAVDEGNLSIFGAGKNAQKIWNEYHWRPVYYVDNNKKRIGEKFLDKEIVSPERLKQDKTMILVAANDFTSIYWQLREIGIEAARICNGNRLL